MNRIRGLWKILFGRTTLLAILLLVQVIFLVGVFAVLNEHVFLLNQLMGVIALIIIFYILNHRHNASFKLTWIVLILALPVLGVFFYVFTKMQPGTATVRKRIEREIDRQSGYLMQDQGIFRELLVESPENAGLVNYMHDYGNYPVYKESQVKYFPSGEEKFKELLAQLELAEEYIFMEYFIVDKGIMWDSILEILERKAREGVEVRFMYDGTCSLSLLPPYYGSRLEKKGIQCRVFAPLQPFLTTHHNNRDHRKIVVIDGHTAFTGGVNLADEYINERERFGHWKDTAVMIKGPAVRSFTLMFLQMWDVSSKKKTNLEKYLKYDFVPDPEMHGDGYVLPYGDSPYDDENVGERVYMDILYNAKEYVHIMTPYLILDDEMVAALTYAVKRGVDVKIIMPHIPDKEYAYILARTYYPILLAEGVEIYEYTPGFVHAKVFTRDDEKAVGGTINLDFRSLYLHFEDAVYMYKNSEVYNIEADFQDTLSMCQRITIDDCRNYSVVKRIAGAFLKIVAPLM